MPKQTHIRILTLCFFVVVTNGCATGGSRLTQTTHAQSTSYDMQSPGTPYGVGEVVGNLLETYALNAMDYETALANASRRYNSDPNRTNELELAVLLHRSKTFEGPTAHSRAALQAVIATHPALPESIDDLIAMHLADAKRQSELIKDNQSLETQVKRLKQQILTQSDRHDQELDELTTALAATEAKIRALTSLEEAIKRNGKTEEIGP